jgi:hypothetical protein
MDIVELVLGLGVMLCGMSLWWVSREMEKLEKKQKSLWWDTAKALESMLERVRRIEQKGKVQDGSGK